MGQKIWKAFSGFLVAGLCTAMWYYSQQKDWKIVEGICSVILGVFIPNIWESIVDISDVSSWQQNLRKMVRAKIIKKSDSIRVSFAYLFRIKIDDKYLLVLNERGTGKFQPVGGAFKMNEEELLFLKNKCYVMDDNKIKLDDKSRLDYRLFVPACKLKKFVKRFDKTVNRENIENLSREFKEELVSTHIIDFDKIKYRYCGRHFSDISYSRHFQCYELLMADIVELLPNEKQLSVFRQLQETSGEKYIYATEAQIKKCGIDDGGETMIENIADHSTKILQENEILLQQIRKVRGNVYECTLY